VLLISLSGVRKDLFFRAGKVILDKEIFMAPRNDDSLSVLIVEEEPEILAFLARILDANGMRALLARSLAEAMGIARRGYVPIDVVLTDLELTDSFQNKISGAEVVDRVRELRPDVRALYMSAQYDAGVIRVGVMNGFAQSATNLDDEGLLESIRNTAAAPMARGSGGA
jgi:DNA-binding NtrC family response regulator